MHIEIFSLSRGSVCPFLDLPRTHHTHTIAVQRDFPEANLATMAASVMFDGYRRLGSFSACFYLRATPRADYIIRNLLPAGSWREVSGDSRNRCSEGDGCLRRPGPRAETFVPCWRSRLNADKDDFNVALSPDFVFRFARKTLNPRRRNCAATCIRGGCDGCRELLPAPKS